MSSSPEQPPPPPLHVYSIISESNRIYYAHSHHLRKLSLLFLFPLSLFTTIYFPLQNILTSSASQFHHHSQNLLRHHFPTTTTNSTVTANTTVSLLLPLIYDVVSLFLSILAVGSITFSVYHLSFRRRPVKFITSILSLLRSFLPLLLTSLTSLLIQFLIISAFGVLLFVILVFQFMVFEIDPSSPFFFWSFYILGVALLLVLIYLQVNWAFSSIIVVVEYTWGFEPLRRSTKLVKGVRGTALSLMVIYGIVSGMSVFMVGSLFMGDEFDGGIWTWRSWLFAFYTVTSAASVMILMLYYLIANTVLYMYCKAVHGEHVAGEEFDGKYVSLPFDDEKVDHFVSGIPNSEFGMP